MNKWNELVEAAFREFPETRDSNDVLWVKVVRGFCSELGINNLDDLYLGILRNQIPNSHTIAAAASCVRKEHPELQPTTRSKARKEEIRQEYINNYYNI